MADSQKFIARNRAPRVQIEYDVEVYGAEKKIQLPFVMGVMADLSGKSEVATGSVADRKFLEIDIDNFDDRMKAMKPRAVFNVPNTLTGEGSLSIDLTFESMDDFSPAAIASKVGPLRKLLEARTQLSNLTTYMDGKAGAEDLIQSLLEKPEQFRALVAGGAAGVADVSGILDAVKNNAPADTPEPGDTTQSVLQSLADSAPDDVPDDTGTQDVLASLKAQPIEEQVEDSNDDLLDAMRAQGETIVEETDDGSADVLASVAAMEVADEPEDDGSADVLASVAATEIADEPEDDGSADVLASVAATEIADEPEDDGSADVLASVAATEIADEPEDDGSADVLASVAATEIADEPEDDGSADVLASVAATEVADEPEDDGSADVLASVAATEVADEPEDDGSADVLASVAAMEVADESEDDGSADVLVSVAATEIADEPEDDGSADVLASVAATEIADEPEDDGLDDLLGELADSAVDEAAVDETADVLASVVDIEEDGAADLDALLADDADGEDADLDALLADDAGDEDTDLDALLAEDADGEDTDLDALLADDADGEDADLDALLADDADDEDADLDALLADDADDEDTDLDALLADDADDEDADLDALLADDADDEDTDLDALLADDAGDEDADLDALLADDADDEDTDLDALLADDAGDEDADLDALLADDTGVAAVVAEDGADAAVASAGAKSKSAYSPGFGKNTKPKPQINAGDRRRMRIAVLGDFSGRANRGDLQIGAELAARKPIKFDVDTYEDVIKRFATTLNLPLGNDGSSISVELSELDELHPDELYDNVELFAELAALRTQVQRGTNLDSVVTKLQGWGQEFGDFKLNSKARAKGSKANTTLAVSDFASLIGGTIGEPVEPTGIDAMIQRIVAPFVVNAPDSAQDSMLAAVDQALSAAMGSILHHPDFQAVESNWRSLELLARRIETGQHLELVLYDVAVEEFTADLAAQEDVGESGLYDMLVERPRLDESQGPLAAVFGMYTFEETPPHAELLARMSKISAHMDAPFVSAIGAGFLNTKVDDLPPIIAKTWAAFRETPEAKYIALAAPRFLLRIPYGKKTEPVDPFDYEEFNIKEGLRSLLMGNPTVLVAILLAETLAQQGADMRLGSIMSIDDMPFHYMTDSYGDQVALPSTERLVNVSMAADTVNRGYLPILSIQGQNVIRLGSFNAVGGGQLLGLWSGDEAKSLSSGNIQNRTGVGLSTGAVTSKKPDTRSASASPEGEDQDSDDFDLGGDDDFDLGGDDLDLGGDDDLDLGGDDLGLDLDLGGDDSDLDDLLAGFDDDGDDDDGDMDDELAALLGDL